LGYRNVWAADCILIHHESVSRGFENTPEKIERFRHEVAYMQSRWGHIIWNDPCYSPNLTLEGMHCQLANPPRVPALPLPNQSTAKASPAIRYGLVIPTKNAGPRWELVLASLKKQQGLAPEVLVVDSGSTDHTNRLTRLSGYRCVEIAPQLFSHGKTRQQALEQLNCDIVFFLTQDAVLATPTSLLELSGAFDDPQVAVAYGRQLPRPDAKFSDWMLRRFNYPAQSAVRSFDDRKRLGLRCAFNSNSFSAYRVSALLAVGGFDAEIPVGEDIVACAALLQAGYKSAYVAHSYVIHSHNYRLAEEFERYRQIGQMHKMRPELLETFGRPEGEGFRLVVSELKAAFRISPWAVLSSLARAAVKYLGYRRGVVS
jgi:rhamnosyltransferase